MWNNPIENSVSIERKTADRYMGPYMVNCRTEGGAYILTEMDGTLLKHKIAAFRLIPYIKRWDLDSWASQSDPRSNSDPRSSQESSQDSDQQAMTYDSQDSDI